MPIENKSRAILARWARDALREYARVSGGGVTESALIPLAVASLAHLAEQIDGADAGRVALDTGRALYEEESR